MLLLESQNHTGRQAGICARVRLNLSLVAPHKRPALSATSASKTLPHHTTCLVPATRLQHLNCLRSGQNPSDVLSVLLIIGGDIVQTALAQTAGNRIVPVCFSFGWVAYSFSTLVRVLGDGRLLPPPDFPTKAFNLKSTYVRENKN